MPQNHRNLRRWIAVSGAVVLVYSVVVALYVASSPDLRLRALLLGSVAAEQPSAGVELHQVEGLEFSGEEGAPPPRPGDILLQVGPLRVESFLQFASIPDLIRGQEIPPGGHTFFEAEPPSPLLPWLVSDTLGDRWVRIEFRRADSDNVIRGFARVQMLPLAEILLTHIWLVLQLGVTFTAAVAAWHRPQDRSTRLFYAMTLLTTVAFVGGSHWWIVSGRLSLLLPLVLAALLLPASYVHFLVVYPRPRPFHVRHPMQVVAAIYGAPLLLAVVLAAAVSGSTVLAGSPAFSGTRAGLDVTDWLLSAIRSCVSVALVLAFVYFSAAAALLIHSLRTTDRPIERLQLRWILAAELGALLPVGYTLYLAAFDRVGFAFGAARGPMFAASLLIMLAYAIGMSRYRLMLVEQFAGKGELYYLISFILTIGVSLAVALGSLLGEMREWRLSGLGRLAFVLLLAVSIIGILALRDWLQQAIDRRFFREKYQLDKALRQMNTAVGHVSNQETLADLMLISCRDVLRVEAAALYLRHSDDGPFQLAASRGTDHPVMSFHCSAEAMESLHAAGSLQRVTPGSRSGMSAAQQLLRELNARLIYALETDPEVASVVVLGPRENGAPFTAEDLTFLNAVGQITSVALRSARIRQELARLNEELKQREAEAEAQKRQIGMLQAELRLAGTPEEHNTRRPAVRQAAPAPFHRDAIKGSSYKIEQVLETVRKVAWSDSSVMIRGESGTGKELLAQVIHDNSPRAEQPIVRVHCASLSPGLLESELFGHVKGAFTGAHQDRAGRFEMASGGTLFLDEIGDISLETQVKLLRVLQERSFERVGGTETIHVDVRLVTATHRNLEELIEQGRFREDLYYRLNVISVTMPPLRERMEDLYELVLHFVNRSVISTGKQVTGIDPGALAVLEDYNWPGNIRELQNIVERAVVLCEQSSIGRDDLPAQVLQRQPEPSLAVAAGGRPQLQSRQSAEAGQNDVGAGPGGSAANLPADASASDERDMLEMALREAEGNKAQAARLVGMPRSTFYSKLQRYDIRY
ncbi:MAG: sigma 54-interacting transcriptional regulator [Planctomycetaceae bacterium]|nr:sigma 54-interacting transcriptional regulator [Planctomycetaceae bacterium]